VFIEAKDDGAGGDNWIYKSCKAPVKPSPPTSSILQAGCPSLSPNQQCQSTGGKCVLLSNTFLSVHNDKNDNDFYENDFYLLLRPKGWIKKQLCECKAIYSY